MSQWKQVSSKQRQGKAQSKEYVSKEDIEIQQEIFLSSFKTCACPNEATFHDYRTCYDHHAKMNDIRRNPFKDVYGLDEVKTDVERMYHPTKFKTSYCKNPLGCPFKEYCAKAHTELELRNEEHALSLYALTVQLRPEPIKLSGFVSQSVKVPSTDITCARDIVSVAPWAHMAQQVNHEPSAATNRMFLERSSIECFMVSSSKRFRGYLGDIALHEGLCTLQVQRTPWEEDHQLVILLKGMNVEAASSGIRVALLSPPEEYFILREDRCVSDRVRYKLQTAKSELIPKRFEKIIYFEIQDSSIKACIMNENNSAACQFALNSVFDKIKFWVQQEDYDAFRDCYCCLTQKNTDEGIECECGQFICSTEDCLEGFVKSSLPQIQGQQGRLLCPMCQSEMNIQTIAARLRPETWNELHNAIVANEVKSEYEKLQSAFDRRLEEKVEQLIAGYHDVEAYMKHKAQSNAAKARNEALNLKCPHCATVYVDFEGCMALKCSTCSGDFCGYCHTKTKSSSGAHEHVRSCIMNETRTGTYYATKEEIKVAQRKYRTREIKRFLLQFKKEEQNATIIELQADLKDLDIDPASLFELGNELRNLYEDD